MGPKKGVDRLMDKIIDWIAAGLILLGLAGIVTTILWHLVIGGTIATDLMQ